MLSIFNSVCIIAGIFLAVVSGISALIGFSTTLAAAKKQDTKYFNKGAMTTVDLHTTGVSLALRALGWGTFYAVSGTGLLAYGIWKLSGAKDVISILVSVERKILNYSFSLLSFVKKWVLHYQESQKNHMKGVISIV